MDIINEYLRRTRSYKGYRWVLGEKVRPAIVCKDGFSISVQASAYHYCAPRIDGADKYDTVELGFPNCEEPLIEDYAEEPDNLTDTVYGYVPVDLVVKMIEKHGGIIN